MNIKKKYYEKNIYIACQLREYLGMQMFTDKQVKLKTYT